ncbi:MAG TPA: hypothetical protein VF812_15555 [Ktedonobacterales bacterium]
MSHMNGTIRQPQNDEQRRQNAAYTTALAFARERYTPEAHIVELVDQAQAPTGAAPSNAPGATLWHALVALEDGRHAVVGVRVSSESERAEAFEVSQPTLGDVRDH